MLWFSPAIRSSRLVEQFDAKPAAELKAMFGKSLVPARFAELREKMLYAGLLPI